MHVIEPRQVEKRLATEQLEPAAGIRRAISQQSGPDPVGDPGWEALGDRVAPAGPVSGHEHGSARAGIPHGGTESERRLQQHRNVRRIVLAVAVKGRDPLSGGGPYAGYDRGALAAASAMAKPAQRGADAARLAQPRRGRIEAAVIHIDDLEIPPGERAPDLADQRKDARLLVANGHDDREERREIRLPRPAGGLHELWHGGRCVALPRCEGNRMRNAENDPYVCAPSA